MDLHDNRVSLFTLIGGLIGCCGGFSLARWVEAVALPLNIGGRPLISVPMFIPITFECTILLGGLTAAISMIMHERTAFAVSSGFQCGAVCATRRGVNFSCVSSRRIRSSTATQTAGFLESLGPEEIAEVAR